MPTAKPLETQPLEPRINSSLLFTRSDGTQEFVHDNLRDFFLAKWFYLQIDSKKLSIQDAFKDYWSYVEDKKVWHLDDFTDDYSRSILPAWKNILMNLTEMLDAVQMQEFVDILTENYFHYQGNQSSQSQPDQQNTGFSRATYNPFVADLSFAAECIGLFPKQDDISVGIVRDELISRSKYDSNLLEAISSIRDTESITYLVEVMTSRNGWDKVMAAYSALINVGSLAVPSFIGLIERCDDHSSFLAIGALRSIGTPEALDYLLTKANSTPGFAIPAMPLNKYYVSDMETEMSFRQGVSYFMDLIPSLTPELLILEGSDAVTREIFKNIHLIDDEESRTQLWLRIYLTQASVDDLIDFAEQGSNDDIKLAMRILSHYELTAALITGEKYLGDNPDSARISSLAFLPNIADESISHIILDFIRNYKPGLAEKTKPNIASDYIPDFLPDIERSLVSGNPEEQLAAARVAGKFGLKSTQDSLLRLVKEDKKNQMQYLHVLAELGCEDIIPICLDIAGSYQGESIRISEHSFSYSFPDSSSALEAIAKLGTPDAMAILIQYFQNPQNNNRNAAISALAGVKYRSAVPSIIDYMENDPSPDRFYGYNALGKIGGSLAFDYLISRIEEPESKGGNIIVEALGDIGDSRAVPFLIRKMEKEYVREYQILAAFKKIGSPEAIPAIAEQIRTCRFSSYECFSTMISISPEDSAKYLVGLLMTHPFADKQRILHTLDEIGGSSPDAMRVLLANTDYENHLKHSTLYKIQESMRPQRLNSTLTPDLN